MGDGVSSILELRSIVCSALKLKTEFVLGLKNRRMFYVVA
jgi:hypothetical protein